MKKLFRFLSVMFATLASFLFVNHAPGANVAGGGLNLPRKANDFFQGNTETRKRSFLGGDVGSLLIMPNDGSQFWSYSLTITNSAGANRIAIINPSYDASSANVMEDGNFLGITGAGNLSAVGDPTTVARFLGYLRKNPSLCVGFSIDTDNKMQIGQYLKLIYKSPWSDGVENTLIRFQDFKKEERFQDKELLIARPFVWDDQTEIQLGCYGTSEGEDAIPVVSTYLFKFAYSLNTELAFRRYAYAQVSQK